MSIYDRRGPICFSSSSNKSIAKQGLLDAAKSSVSKLASSAANNAKKGIQNAATRLKDSAGDASRKASEAVAKEGQKYAGEARRLASRTGETLKQSAMSAAQNANKRVQDSASELVQSTKERVAEQLPAKQRVIETVVSETARKAKFSAASQVHETISNATRWFWWWSLAAIGVYGISTTLTKEGVLAIKEALSKPASKADLANEVAGAPAPTSNKANRNIEDATEERPSRWISSWWRRKED